MGGQFLEHVNRKTQLVCFLQIQMAWHATLPFLFFAPSEVVWRSALHLSIVPSAIDLLKEVESPQVSTTADGSEAYGVAGPAASDGPVG